MEVLKLGKKANSGTVIMSDPVAAGSRRGPHNCEKCDADVAEAIRVFSLTQALVFFTLLDIIFIVGGDPIALSAHLGGAAAGLLMGLWMKKKGTICNGSSDPVEINTVYFTSPSMSQM